MSVTYDSRMALFEPVLEALNDAQVRHVVVGGLAVVLHGHARLTLELDLIVDPDRDQARKAIDALVGLGLRPRVPVDPGEFADPSIRESWIRDRGMTVFSMFDPANPMCVVDLFVAHPIPFGELWSRSVPVDLAGTTVRIASIPDLITMKRHSGRPLDLDDIRQLEIIERSRKGGGDE